MSISIGAGYELPEEKHRVRSAPEAMGGGGGGQDSERMAVVDDLNDKLQVSSLVHPLFVCSHMFFCSVRCIRCVFAEVGKGAGLRVFVSLRFAAASCVGSPPIAFDEMRCGAVRHGVYTKCFIL